MPSSEILFSKIEVSIQPLLKAISSRHPIFNAVLSSITRIYELASCNELGFPVSNQAVPRESLVNPRVPLCKYSCITEVISNSPRALGFIPLAIEITSLLK